MTSGAILLDRILIHGVLGLRFWDEATEQMVDAGLRIAAAPAGWTGPWVQGTANRSGVFAFHRLPGLSSTPFEKPDGRRAYVVEVRDELERFLAFRFTAHAAGQVMTSLESVAASPLTTTGSPLARNAGIPLFNTAARPIPAGMAVIRAELHDATSPEPERTPAPFARLTVDIPGVDGAPDMSATGLADERGRATIILPHPAPAEVPLGSPLTSPSASDTIPLSAQTWPVLLSAGYAITDEPEAPMDLDVVLSAPAADLATIAAGPFAASLPFTLAYGLGLVEEEATAPTPRWVPSTPVLYVRPSVSPP